MMKSYFDWAGWIKHERIARGWTQLEMANRSNIPHWQGRLSLIEAEKITVTFRTVVVAARLFGYSPEEVMEFAGVPYIAPKGDIHKVERLVIGRMVRARRESLGMLRKDLEECIGLSPRGLDHFENQYPVKTRVNVVISLDDVLGFEGELIGLTWALVEKELVEKFQIQ